MVLGAEHSVNISGTVKPNSLKIYSRRFDRKLYTKVRTNIAILEKMLDFSIINLQPVTFALPNHPASLKREQKK